MHQYHSFVFYSFYSAWQLIDANLNPNSLDENTLPWFVNGAFACEVGLKYILSNHQIDYRKTHLLHELYNMLPQADRDAIYQELEFSEYAQFGREDINFKFGLLSNAFDEYRYAYERCLLMDIGFARVLFLAIIHRTLTYPQYRVCERSTTSTDEEVQEANKIEQKAIKEMLSRVQKKEMKKKVL